MTLSIEQVRHIATLARLELTVDEEAQFSSQLGHILGYFESLAAVATDGVEPSVHVVTDGDSLRDDEVTNPPASPALWSNAPALEERQFRVPNIIE